MLRMVPLPGKCRGGIQRIRHLSIPAVAALSLAVGLPIALGLDSKSIVLLFLTLLVASTSPATGRTTILQGAVHLVIFGVYLFTTVVP